MLYHALIERWSHHQVYGSILSHFGATQMGKETVVNLDYWSLEGIFGGDLLLPGRSPHQFQRARIKQMEKKDWVPFQVRIRDGVWLVGMASYAEDDIFGFVYPNGLFIRNIKRRGRNSVNIDWKRAEELASATIPAEGVDVQAEQIS